jgi:hypothetical protein
MVQYDILELHVSECNYLRAVRLHMDTYPTWIQPAAWDRPLFGNPDTRQWTRGTLQRDILPYVCTRTVAVAMDHPYPARYVPEVWEKNANKRLLGSHVVVKRL